MENPNMERTLDLLKKAATIEPNYAEWCRRLGLNRTALTVEERRGKLSPVIAGGLAIELGEDPEHWMALAAYEAAPETTAKRTLAKALQKARTRLTSL
jgi:hypothetical protein